MAISKAVLSANSKKTENTIKKLFLEVQKLLDKHNDHNKESLSQSQSMDLFEKLKELVKLKNENSTNNKANDAQINLVVKHYTQAAEKKLGYFIPKEINSLIFEYAKNWYCVAIIKRFSCPAHLNLNEQFYKYAPRDYQIKALVESCVELGVFEGYEKDSVEGYTIRQLEADVQKEEYKRLIQSYRRFEKYYLAEENTKEPLLISKWLTSLLDAGQKNGTLPDKFQNDPRLQKLQNYLETTPPKMVAASLLEKEPLSQYLISKNDNCSLGLALVKSLCRLANTKLGAFALLKKEMTHSFLSQYQVCRTVHGSLAQNWAEEDKDWSCKKDKIGKGIRSKAVYLMELSKRPRPSL